MIPVIETERLRLRGWKERDFPAYASFRLDPHSQVFAGGAVSSALAWDDFCADLGVWVLRGYGIFAIARGDDDIAIGYTGLWFPPELDEPELCWSLFPSKTGHGYATEAAMAARAWAYETLSLEPLMSFVHPENLASRAVAERLGAVLEGETLLRGAPRFIYRHPKSLDKGT